ncbi:sialidase family protein [Streptomyces sp. NRRL F-5126]|uniref:sialidase family protein n=1 Tax=Streptomyces sp. NRRL F-5126 TaxID=1463857 RepID=UPI00068DD11F|nr:sialidase family protein [Streptomyces sp. NRRL F-5126]
MNTSNRVRSRVPARKRRRAALAGALTTTALVSGLLLAAPGSAAAHETHRTAPSGVTETDIAASTSSTYYRIPDITVSTKGTVLLAYDRRNGSSADLPGDIDTMLVRSTDNGRTWSKPAAVVDYPGPQGCGDSSMIVDRDTGRIFLFCTYSAGKVGFPTSQPGTDDTTDPNTLHVQVRHSDDDGRTWSGPTDLNPQVKDVSWRGYFASSGHGIQTSGGRLIQPLAVADSAGTHHFADIHSDDHGATWHAGALSSADNDESKAVELSDGTIVQNVRPVRAGHRLIATSHDGGQTFSASVADPELPDPSVNGDEIRVNAASHGPHRDWLLFANAADQSARQNMTIRLSCDNGKTWPVRKLLHAGPSGYAAMAMLPDGRVGVFYEGGASSYTEKMVFATLSPGDLGASCGR